MIIPATHTEIEQIYLAAEMSESRSLCITACQSGDGVTSVVAALAERYLLAGHRTLIVDLNTFHPAFECIDIAPSDDDNVGLLVEHASTHQMFTGLTVPKNQSALLAYKDPAQLQNAVTQWLTQYDRVICDTSPLLHINRGNIPAQVVASACDQTALVIMGGKTSSGQLEKAMQLINNPSISLLGSVLNLKQQATLAQEMVRELNRLKFVPKSWRDKWASKILTNEFLAQSA
ncbi:chromosome partitioning protein ParA [Vibrio europaeus]|uniref:Chromosome partitioning protein ParA n=1 Tax=Vibrio europaeus TaxID=300876 RepID=A0A178JG21_9VIBR|nr:chromosome partitioning protein ParA [Vibrio europaeus]MDC5707387.1 chromosome partitioning protein ParA [Vibrio europaeus]MDC5712752.1 chromosome partitioning protein ParA [Vibrio europaeus]MDC5717395.1 chromosome partitioning protein ParA [Vibrio europaeus]MDC5721070.1 chromosome partitioning protein ParA [Vibrio europaeus]MDC5726695.1 chromosome partitioning protein ParA [Vibrio europaeus]